MLKEETNLSIALIKARQAVAQAQALLISQQEGFVSMTSHEFRTPIDIQKGK